MKEIAFRNSPHPFQEGAETNVIKPRAWHKLNDRDLLSLDNAATTIINNHLAIITAASHY